MLLGRVGNAESMEGADISGLTESGDNSKITDNNINQSPCHGMSSISSQSKS
jgi:hypothetical protein